MAQVRQAYKTWTEIKTFLVAPKSLELQYHEFTYYYKIFVLEAGVEYFTEIWKDTSQVKGINVSQNDTDKTDFEGNYKADANQAIEMDVTVENDITVDQFGSGAQIDANVQGDVNAEDNPYPGASFIEYLKNGSSSDMNVDGSSTPVEFTISPPSGKIWYVRTISIVIEDDNINFTKFGGIAGSLTNGVDFKVKQNGLAEVLLANVKRNAEFASFTDELDITSASSDILIAHLKLRQNSGTSFKLVNSNSDYIKAVVNDDLDSLTGFKILIKGYEVDE